jgi:hypothetical protein
LHTVLLKPVKKAVIKNIKGNHVVIVPSPKKEIPIGTLQSIIKQAGLTKEDFDLR